MSISTLKLFHLWGLVRRRLDSIARVLVLHRAESPTQRQTKRKPKRVFFEMP